MERRVEGGNVRLTGLVDARTDALLLEHLVAAALSNGIQRFDAHTLGDNRQMLDVFRHAGFAVRRSLDAGEKRMKAVQIVVNGRTFDIYPNRIGS